MRLRPASQILLRVTCAALLFLALDRGVLSFVRIIQDADGGPPPKADAIVVFSGDPSRITRGFDLLAGGRAPLLFTAGVDNGPEIEAEKKAHPALASCCVDGEQVSGTTHEDAVAIARWARARHVSSLIVVTTNIHMPRAIAELNGQIGGVTLWPAGVSQGLYDSRDWADDPRVRPQLKREWAEYIAVRLDNLFGWRSWRTFSVKQT